MATRSWIVLLLMCWSVSEAVHLRLKAQGGARLERSQLRVSVSATKLDGVRKCGNHPVDIRPQPMASIVAPTNQLLNVGFLQLKADVQEQTGDCSCPKGETCCNDAEGGLQGCPHSNGVCCPKSDFCCAPGHECSANTGKVRCVKSAPQVVTQLLTSQLTGKATLQLPTAGGTASHKKDDTVTTTVTTATGSVTTTKTVSTPAPSAPSASTASTASTAPTAPAATTPAGGDASGGAATAAAGGTSGSKSSGPEEIVTITTTETTVGQHQTRPKAPKWLGKDGIAAAIAPVLSSLSHSADNNKPQKHMSEPIYDDGGDSSDDVVAQSQPSGKRTSEVLYDNEHESNVQSVSSSSISVAAPRFKEMMDTDHTMGHTTAIENTDDSGSDNFANIIDPALELKLEQGAPTAAQLAAEQAAQSQQAQNIASQSQTLQGAIDKLDVLSLNALQNSFSVLNPSSTDIASLAAAGASSPTADASAPEAATVHHARFAKTDPAPPATVTAPAAATTNKTEGATSASPPGAVAIPIGTGSNKQTLYVYDHVILDLSPKGTESHTLNS